MGRREVYLHIKNTEINEVKRKWGCTEVRVTNKKKRLSRKKSKQVENSQESEEEEDVMYYGKGIIIG